MSSAFEGHGETRLAERPSGVTYALSHGHISVHDPSHDHGHDHDHGDHDHTGPHLYDLSITKSIFGMLLMMALMLVLFSGMARSYTKRPGQAPTGLTNAVEPLVLFIRDEVAVPNIGAHKADKFLPFLMTVFFFIFFANLLGLVPFIGGFNVTGTLGITMVMAAMVFAITAFNGNKHYWGHLFWPPGVPLFVMPIIIPIEIVGMFLKPIVLMIRLTANISAGHIIILSFVSLVLIFGQGGEALAAGYGIGIFSTAFMIFMYCLELLVAFLQAFVFTLLAAIYFGEATHEAHH
jgi:F-type H+-transporting ATPase subunit a